jgi:hypothetical protein
VRAVIAATELVEKAADPIANLSRGYRQRVGVAQAILHQPKIDGPDVTYKYRKPDSTYLFASSGHDYVFRVTETSISALTQANRSKMLEQKRKPGPPQTSHSKQRGGDGG